MISVFAALPPDRRVPMLRSGDAVILGRLKAHKVEDMLILQAA